MMNKNLAEIRWDNVPILTKRPEDMSYEDYRLYLKAQKYLLKQYKSQGKYITGTVYDPDQPSLQPEEPKIVGAQSSDSNS